ncbi:hypothetical protein F2Q70_00022057 [Brassica cretica]|uniref:Uncharacterized protein n=1 Tax=Brassica cretica TaxID=69181 RepID=A0A8S9GLL8_BRACR|nr:hypothetical protein F2Q70_00022057 [Brassica cretica]
MNSLCPTSQSNLTRATTRGRLPFTLRSDLTRARPRGRSPFTLRSDFLERQGEVAPAPERPHHSDTQRSLGLCQFDSDEQAGSDVPQRLPEVALSTQSDLPERGAEVAARRLFGRTYDLSRAFWSFCYARFTLSKPMFKYLFPVVFISILCISLHD